MIAENIDPQERQKFEDLAPGWWDRDGQLRTLHDINPLRLEYITNRAVITGQKVLDIGCGGGILCESLAQQHARVTGIDISPAAIAVATRHSQENRLDIHYEISSPEQYAQENPEAFDVITCMEMLEHVPDPEAIVAACAKLIRPGGNLFFSTINRTPKAWLQAIVAAEYLFNIIPAGTHEFAKFIRPSELARLCQQHAMTICDIAGIKYLPYIRSCYLTQQPSVNYLLHARAAGTV
jgi:2-polyprenyl-6-hydroxyphenyl methylase / 3-demethylubiquinone-9 3-methyltransferase